MSVEPVRDTTLIRIVLHVSNGQGVSDGNYLCYYGRALFPEVASNNLSPL